MRASASLMRFRSTGSEDVLSLSASSKNLFFSASFDSIPVSISSTKTRFVLVCWLFAIVRTRRARRGGRETLWRTGFSVVDMVQLYTIMKQCAPTSRCHFEPTPAGEESLVIVGRREILHSVRNDNVRRAHQNNYFFGCRMSFCTRQFSNSAT